MCLDLFFLFKQKTAYEMRISDWSSDVCSSDLATRKRVEAIARQLNYAVDKNASALRRGQSNTLALLFFEDPSPDGSAINPFFLSMLESILRTCAARRYDLLTSM